jgi:hypothetical protein
MSRDHDWGHETVEELLGYVDERCEQILGEITTRLDSLHREHEKEGRLLAEAADVMSELTRPRLGLNVFAQEFIPGS